MEQILIVLCKVTLTAIAWSVEVDFALRYAIPNKD